MPNIPIRLSAILLCAAVVLPAGQVYSKDPDAAQDLIVQGQEAYYAGKYVEALACFKTALDADPTNRSAQSYVDLLEDLAPSLEETAKQKYEQPAEQAPEPQRGPEAEPVPSAAMSDLPQAAHESAYDAPERTLDFELREQPGPQQTLDYIPETVGYAAESSQPIPAREQPADTTAVATDDRFNEINSLLTALETEISSGQPEPTTQPIARPARSGEAAALMPAEPPMREQAQTPAVVVPLPGSPEQPREKILVSGELRLGLGFTSDDVIWKDANADYIGVPREKNYRYLFGADRYNTYDKKIFSRFKLGLQSNMEGPLNGYVEFVNDPWSYIGTRHVTVYSTAGGDSVDMDLKYWSNDGRTLNEVYRSNKGNIVSVDQIKVVDGKTTPATPRGIFDWYTNFNRIDEADIKRDYRFVRKLWFDYRQDDYNLRIFPLSDEYEALTTDDPLRLSNNHIYWEESPWLAQYEPARRFYQDNGAQPVKPGRWVNNLSFVSKDSDLNRLTFLRGLSYKTYAFEYPLDVVVATPLTLWDDYDTATSAAGAARLRVPTDIEGLKIGFTSTTRVGFAKKDVDAVNQVGAMDFEYLLDSALQKKAFNTVYGQVAGSYTTIGGAALGFRDETSGVAGKLGYSYDGRLEKETGLRQSTLYAAYMYSDFYPGLSNYRYTRSEDATWSRHINFGKLNPEDEVRVFGDGIDRGRFAAGLRLTGRPFVETLDSDIRARYVTEDRGKFIEAAGRLENTYKPDIDSPLTLKSLLYYKQLPDTVRGVEPLIWTKNMYSLTDYFAEEDTHPYNEAIIGGLDPSIGAADLGARYEFVKDRFAGEAVFGVTNDPLDFPRGLLNDNFVTTQARDGVLYDKVVPFLYDQKFFAVPPYDYYNIYKGRLIYTPSERWEHVFSFTRNDNRFAAGIDDNVNHFGFETTFRANYRWTIWFKYTYSRMIDILKQNQQQARGPYEGHHNLFLGTEWRLNPDETFTLLWGEFAGYNDPYGESYWSLSTLDTRHVFRAFYRRKF